MLKELNNKEIRVKFIGKSQPFYFIKYYMTNDFLGVYNVLNYR